MNRIAILLAVVLGLCVMTSVTVILLQQHSVSSLQRENAQLRQTQAATNSTNSGVGLAGLRASDIPGRYHWIENGKDLGIVELFPDHTATGPGGQKSSRNRWFLQPQGFVIAWPNSFTIFTHAIEPGHYLGADNKGRKEMINEK